MSPASAGSVVRAVFAAVRVHDQTAPYDTIHAKVHYPAVPTGSDEERLTGAVPADAARAPFPVVVFLNGINVGPEAYGWLAQRLAAEGTAVVTFSWVGELFPGQYGLTPGLDVGAARPDTYGTRPTATAVRPLLDMLRAMHDGDGPLAGMLDLDRVAIGGHSGGATVALHSSRHAFFPSVRCVFGYAGHTVTSTALGWEPGALAPIPADCPVLIMGGTRDGVMQRSADRYGAEGHGSDPVVRTFDEGVADDAVAYLAIIDGANHFAMGHPEDPTVARGFLDLAPDGDPAAHRTLVADLTVAFLRRHLLAVADDLDGVLASSALAVARRKPAGQSPRDR